MLESLSFIMDIMIMAGLAATIYFTFRLTRSLDNFKKHRNEFNNLIQELSGNIEKAQMSVDALKNASDETGERLDKALRDGRELLDELDLMNGASNSLAERLEGLAEKNRRIAQGLSDFGEFEEEEGAFSEDYIGANEPEPGRAPVGEPGPSFFIRDREYEADEDEAHSSDDEGAFQSQAEKELFEALRAKKSSA